MTLLLITRQKKALEKYKIHGRRRLIALQPKEQDFYIDFRNLWKGSSKAQEKQYESIKNSGLLDSSRKLTFMKFNYRYAEEKQFNYTKIFKTIKSEKSENSQFFSETSHYKKKKLEKQVKNLTNSVIKDIQNNSFKPQKNWIQEYHECSDIQRAANDRIKFKKKQIMIGTMNVNDLWGEKQLQESLGFLPCKRDRPKILKLYSSKMKMRRLQTEPCRYKQFTDDKENKENSVNFD